MVPKKRARTETLQESTSEASPAPPPPPSEPDVAMTNMENSPDDKQITDPSDPPEIPLNQTKFEDIFYNPQTHITAVAMLNSHLQSMSKSIPSGSSRQRARSGDEMNLRSRDPKPEKQGPSKTDNAVPGQSAQVPGTSKEGTAMVHELLNRYETNKRKAKYGTEEVKAKPNVDPLDDDSFEFDEAELDLWDDEEEDDPEQKSDFLKYTVPQYEIKQKLCDMHHSTIKRMTPAETEKACLALLPELRGILNETVFCKRHEIFKQTGLSKHVLREITVAEPFNNVQDKRVMDVISEVLLADKEPEQFSGELLQYMSHVLVPEALTRIYATKNKISIELAEKELRFGAGYDGQVDDELVKTLTESVGNTDNVELVKNENVV